MPIRAAFAFAGGGSLGTFLSGATRELLRAIRAHNAAVADGAPAGDSRYLNGTWGRVTIDAIGGSSAGALCASQLVRSLFDPSYLGGDDSVAVPNTMTGDWVHGGDFERLAVDGNTPERSGPVEAPGWTLISGARLFDLARRAIGGASSEPDPHSPLDPSGIVAIGITLTDLLGYHQPAEFPRSRVMGHPSFGAPEATYAKVQANTGKLVHDLGGRGHAEVRKLFVASDKTSVGAARRFLRATQRLGRARAISWSPEAAERLASLVGASAALPFAVGPLALTDQAADQDSVNRRLYMDGGILNNKPISPALKLARWHDGVRLMAHQDPETDEFPIDAIERELVYERVCFFIDAFPDRFRDEWRSPHPDDVLRDTAQYELTPEAVRERNGRIDEALASPHAAIGALFNSMMTSLRAQDILGIAKTNHRLIERRTYIDDRCASVHEEPPGTFRIDTVAKATAYAAVASRPASRGLSEAQRLAVAHRVWDSDRFSGLGGRRAVTMVPVFAPDNLRAVFAGEALYALGGLLGYEARKHDASVGVQVAKQVIRSLDPERPRPEEIRLAPAPDAVVPDDTTHVVRRLVVAGEAALEGFQNTPTALGFFARLPFRWQPVVRAVKGWLDQRVMGQPEE